MTSALSVRNLTKIYDNGLQALSGVNLIVEEGDFFALLGYNGAGKTTMLGCIAGLLNKSGGDIEVFGHDTVGEPNLAKREIGIVPQEFNFSFFEKVIDIVVWQAGYFGIPKKQALINAEEILKQLDLWDKREEYSRNLSGGMKRRLMIARALVHKPRLLILDEPTAGVDVELRRGMYEYLEKINREGTTIILTTHYLEEAEQLCRNVAIIKKGQIVKQGPIKELIKTLDKEVYLVDLKQIKDLKQVTGFTLNQVDDNTVQVEITKNQSLNDFIAALDKAGLEVTGMRAKDNRLEELFINVLNQA
jgi:ABC-2 type transport system ATP-binding protein